MNPLVVEIADRLHLKLQYARSLMGVYYDDGVFRVSPVSGPRFVRTVTAFPDCIVGVYNSKVGLQEFEDDLLWFCEGMGLRTGDAA